jgi:ABC-type branched-subunit amino acid transport system permease subunit
VSELLVYVILGLGPGAVNALLGLGLVTIYRGSGVLNFGHAAVAMYVAFVFRSLRQSFDWPTPLAFVAALAVAALLGLLIHLVVMHPLRHAPALARVTGSLGVLLTLASVAYWQFGSGTFTVNPLTPTEPVEILGVLVGWDRILLVAVAVGLTAALSLLYQRTLFGLATRAAAETEKGAAIIGYSQARLAAINWMIGSVLAGVGGILISPIARLNALQMSLLIAAALAAALLGRFENLWLVLAGGMLLGVGESVIGKYLNDIRGLTATLPFLLIVLVLVVKGSALPERGELVYSDMPLAPPVHRVALKLGVFAAASVALLLLLPASYAAAYTIALIGGVIILSLVVIVGWVGQISLCQVGFTGVGAYATIRVANHLGIDFPFSIVLGALVAVPVGVLVGLPALRVRGVNLAVVTLGAAIALERMVFNNPTFTGGDEGSAVPQGASLFGLDLDGRTEPARYGIVVLVVLCLCVAMVANLRRSVTGRRMLAVRADETAAAASGIDVRKVKLQAFGLSAFIAAIAGGLMAYRAGRVSEGSFVVFQSINFFALAYIGGIATIGGALAGTLLAPGAPFSLWLRNAIGNDQVSQTLSGVGLIATVVTQPDGVANVVRSEREKRRIKAARAETARQAGRPPAPAAGAPVRDGAEAVR